MLGLSHTQIKELTYYDFFLDINLQTRAFFTIVCSEKL